MIRAIRPAMDRQPRPGSIVAVHVGGPLRAGRRWRRFIVESFGATRDRRHLTTVRALDNGARFTVSGFYCEEIAPRP